MSRVGKYSEKKNNKVEKIFDPQYLTIRPSTKNFTTPDIKEHRHNNVGVGNEDFRLFQIKFACFI